MVIYWFSKLIVVAIMPLFEALRRFFSGRTGFLEAWEYFIYSVNKANTSTLFVTITALLITLLLVWLVYVIRRKKFFSFFYSRKIYVSTVVSAFLIAFGLNAIALLVVKMPFLQYFSDGHATLIRESVSGELWLVVLIAGIISPMFEELFFRGIVFGEFSSAGGFFFANFFQSLFFAIMHFNLMQGIYAFIIGFALGGVYRLSKTIYIPMAIHILFNLSNIFFGNYIMGFSFMSYFMVCGLISFVLGFLLLWKK